MKLTHTVELVDLSRQKPYLRHFYFRFRLRDRKYVKLWPRLSQRIFNVGGRVIHRCNRLGVRYNIYKNFPGQTYKLGVRSPNPKITKIDPEIFLTNRISTYFFKREQTLSPNIWPILRQIAKFFPEKWGFEIWGYGPFSTSTPFCTLWPKIFIGRSSAPWTLPNAVGIGSKTTSGVELWRFEYCENCHFGGEYLDNPRP